MPPKQLSGCEKLKKKKRDEDMRKSQAGAMYKFMKKALVEEPEEMEEPQHVDEQEHVQVEPEEMEEQKSKMTYKQNMKNRKRLKGMLRII